MKGLRWSILGCFSQIEMTLKLLIQSFSTSPPPFSNPVPRDEDVSRTHGTLTGKSFMFMTPEERIVRLKLHWVERKLSIIMCENVFHNVTMHPG